MWSDIESIRYWFLVPVHNQLIENGKRDHINRGRPHRMMRTDKARTRTASARSTALFQYFNRFRVIENGFGPCLNGFVENFCRFRQPFEANDQHTHTHTLDPCLILFAVKQTMHLWCGIAHADMA